MNIFAKHQIKTAKQIMKLSCVGARLLGSMDHVCAYYTLMNYGKPALLDPSCDCKINGSNLTLNQTLKGNKEGK